MMGLFNNSTTVGTEKPLHQVWIELNTESLLSLNEQKVYVYNNIVKLMNEGEDECIFPASKVTYVDKLAEWLEDMHKLDACVGDCERDSGEITKVLVVKW
jgi:hypothetical protein